MFVPDVWLIEYIIDLFSKCNEILVRQKNKYINTPRLTQLDRPILISTIYKHWDVL